MVAQPVYITSLRVSAALELAHAATCCLMCPASRMCTDLSPDLVQAVAFADKSAGHEGELGDMPFVELEKQEGRGGWNRVLAMTSEEALEVLLDVRGELEVSSCVGLFRVNGFLEACHPSRCLYQKESTSHCTCYAHNFEQPVRARSTASMPDQQQHRPRLQRATGLMFARVSSTGSLSMAALTGSGGACRTCNQPASHLLKAKWLPVAMSYSAPSSGVCTS